MSETIALYDAVRILARQAERPKFPALVYALRHPETWPEGFVWDYGDCNTCAIGLAARLWNGSNGYVDILRFLKDETIMSYEEARKIFFHLGADWVPPVEKDAITPDDVADAIDRYLASVG